MPDWREEIAGRLSSLKLDSNRENEIVEELSQHLEDRYNELVSGGARDEDARSAVLMELDLSVAISLVRWPASSTSLTAASMAAAASAYPKVRRNISATDRIVAIGFAIP